MFAKANRKVILHTFPIVMAYKRANRKTGVGTGTYFFINDEGWFVSALHVFEKMFHLFNEFQKGDIINWSVYYGVEGLLPDTNIIFTIPEIDLFVGKMLNPSIRKTQDCAEFRNPEKELYPGTSLCRLGFAFNKIVPTFTGGLRLNFNRPLAFPIDGIFTRLSILEDDLYNFPLMNLQTSSPGISGQSGGPVYDTSGAICAMQNTTIEYDLDFNETQKFYCGNGVHFETITSFLRSINVKFNVSNDKS